MPSPPSVIITTAYHQYAVEGYSLNVTDYLLKPFAFDRFLVAINKVKLALHQKGDSQEKEAGKDHLFVNWQKMKVKIYYADILYVESQKEYIKIVTTKKEYQSKMSTHEMEALLPSHLFKRIHRSFIVSVDKVESYNAEMVKVGATCIPVGRAYKDVLNTL